MSGMRGMRRRGEDGIVYRQRGTITDDTESKRFGLFGPDDSPELIRNTQAIRIVRDPSASVNFTLFNIK